MQKKAKDSVFYYRKRIKDIFMNPDPPFAKIGEILRNKTNRAYVTAEALFKYQTHQKYKDEQCQPCRVHIIINACKDKSFKRHQGTYRQKTFHQSRLSTCRNTILQVANIKIEPYAACYGYYKKNIN